MPVAGAGPGGTNQSRQTFRPPWVKDGPPPIPMPTQPWVKSNRPNNQPENKAEASSLVTKALRKLSDAAPPEEAAAAAAPAPVRKTSKITITPSLPKENGLQNNVTSKEPPRKTSVDASKQPETSKKVSEVAAQKPPPKPAEPTKKVEAKAPEKPAESQPSSRPRGLERTSTKDKYEGVSAAPAKSAPPPPPPPAPPMPPVPPPLPVTKPLPEKPLTEEQRQKLEALRARPKRRPDWGNMMKEIEVGKKLNHVKSNDRSAPLLPKVKAKGQFVYESERPNLHNQLLKQIETGVKLKPVRTNDRSKPFIEGLRKFRRQMTIEEQIQKSASMASMGITEVEPDPLDEVDDIDKVRDDLQSTKQMLALELKNKEAMERENKKLLTRILNLEVELEKEKNRVNKGDSVDKTETQKEMKSLREESEKARKTAEEMENKYHEVNDKLEIMKLDLDEAIQKNQRLEKQLKVAQAANLQHVGQPVQKQLSRKIIHQNKVQESFDIDPNETPDESEETETETESENEIEGESEEAQNERRLAREIKLLTTKLKSFKTKREAAKKERKSLKEQMTKQQKAIKDEKKKYKLLQKEVDKMSKLMNEDEEDEEDEEEEEEEVEEEEEEESSEEEESEESESEESEGDLPESAPPEKKKINLQNRTKKYENLLSSLKKGNYLLKANVERYKDEYNKQKEMSLTLQEDLNSVLAELG